MRPGRPQLGRRPGRRIWCDEEGKLKDYPTNRNPPRSGTRLAPRSRAGIPSRARCSSRAQGTRTATSSRCCTRSSSCGEKSARS